MRIIYHCSKCNAVYSAEEGSNQACDVCGSRLTPTGISEVVWDSKSEKEKNITREWLNKPNIKDNNIPAEIQIAQYDSQQLQLNELKAIHFWIKFWSILTIIGFSIMMVLCIVAGTFR